jgi:hypothetical protein
MTGLSLAQKRVLIRLARRAWRLECARVRGLGPGAPIPDFDAWRHDQVHAACGKLGLRLCLQSDYPWVMAHFHQLLGEDDRALRWLMAARQDPRQQAWVALERLMRQRSFSPNYVEAICRRVFDCDLATAQAHQLWRLRGILLHHHTHQSA